MQRLPCQGFNPRLQRRVFNGLQFRGAAVNRIPDNRITPLGQMNPDLVRPAGLDFNIQKRGRAIAFAHFPQRQRVFAVPAFCGHFFAVFRMASHGQNNLAACAFNVSPAKRDIFLIHVMLFKLRGEPAVRLVGLGGNDQAGRFLVQPVDDARPDHPADAGKVVAMKKQRIDEGLIRIPRRGMNDHARRFIDDNNGSVFINDIQRDILRNRNGIDGRLQVKLYDISVFQVPAYFWLFAVHGYIALFNGVFNLRSGKRFVALRKEYIQTQACLFGVYRKDKSLDCSVLMDKLSLPLSGLCD